MSESEWHIRPGRPTDRDLLTSFACADPALSWQTEVEQFIRTQLIDWAFDPGAANDDPRLLLAVVAVTGELFGVAAHERVTLQRAGGPPFNATKIEVIAVAKSWQGRRLDAGVRASDVLMSAVLTDVSKRVPARDARVFAVVHEENHRSLELFERHGLTGELSRPHPSYRRVITP